MLARFRLAPYTATAMFTEIEDLSKQLYLKTSAVGYGSFGVAIVSDNG